MSTTTIRDAVHPVPAEWAAGLTWRKIAAGSYAATTAAGTEFATRKRTTGLWSLDINGVSGGADYVRMVDAKTAAARLANLLTADELAAEFAPLATVTPIRPIPTPLDVRRMVARLRARAALPAFVATLRVA